MDVVCEVVVVSLLCYLFGCMINAKSKKNILFITYFLIFRN